ncbi:hypothetical protein PARPLA_02033 [Rhodobacteraceae bacterium THAF1]|uniref:hypothetical protein n=1 Tax=Palleronia sp. THAF1 TaxID=2587842 RepID=UPI000F3ADC1B|nr:hypothetical protein [Palleronia sp. THAF1]QFU07748.1 hypothetical protein FIU81_03565 [Palleronia sp. THAF1]VDC25563.1 hypothetical protein PARPLA_02033 [Rhodobacteraceae bacterium THAF1]
MFLLITVVLFGVYLSNVVLGALSGSAFMGDVGELLFLAASALSFTAAILKAEATKHQKDQQDVQGRNL